MKEQKNQTYIRCPRCELNYILKKDKFCNVCKLEMRAQGTLGVDENLDLELCPVCKVNYINFDEDMCVACAKEKALEDGLVDEDDDNDGVWGKQYHSHDDDDDYIVGDDEETGDMVSITDLDDAPLDEDDDLGLGLDDDLDDDKLDDEDETFDSDFEDAFDDGFDDDFDDDEDGKPAKKKKK